MINRRALFLILLITLVGSWAAYAMFTGKLISFFKPPKPVEVKTVLVAAIDIPQRLTMSEPMFVRQTIPIELYNDNMVSQFDPAVPCYAAQPISKGEILYRNKLGLVNQEPELSYMIDWNQGCITIATTEVTGVSGLIKPGDFVDVYSTYKTGKDERGGAEKLATRRILRGLQVVATDVEVLPSVGGIGPQNFNRQRGTPPVGTKRMTLAAKKEEIEVLVQAYNVSTIHLALISDAFKKKDDALRALIGETEYLSRKMEEPPVGGIECIRGTKVEMVYMTSESK